jgi:hypothetical protein
MGAERGWTPRRVGARIEEAADVVARLPDERMPGLYDLWPRIVGDPVTGRGMASPPPEAIDRMDETLAWLCWLEPEERRIVWLRAEGEVRADALAVRERIRPARHLPRQVVRDLRDSNADQAAGAPPCGLAQLG